MRTRPSLWQAFKQVPTVLSGPSPYIHHMTSIHLWWTNFYHSLFESHHIISTIWPPFHSILPSVDQFLPLHFWKPSPHIYPSYVLHTINHMTSLNITIPGPITCWTLASHIHHVTSIPLNHFNPPNGVYVFPSCLRINVVPKCLFSIPAESLGGEINPWREHSLLV